MYHSKFDEKTKLWSGCDIPQFFNPKASIGQILLRSMKMNGSRIGQVNADTGVQLTYNELRKLTIQAAQNLQNRNFKPKQVFGFMAKKSDYISPLVFASFCLGCMADMYNPLLPKEAIKHMLLLTKPSLMFCDLELHDLIAECINEVGIETKIFTFHGAKGDSEPVENLFVETGRESCFIPVRVDGENDAAVKLASSGTSGPCKGVLLSHAALLSNVIMLDVTTADDVVFSFSPIDWIMNMIMTITPCLNGGKLVITSQPFSIELHLRIVEEYKVTCQVSPPFHLASISKSGLLPQANLSSLKVLAIGGGKMPLNLLKEYNSYLPNGVAIVGYGISEMAGLVSVDLPKFSGKDTIGQLLGGYTMKIIDKFGNRCDIDTDGEICIKSPHKFLGYCGNDQLTKESFDNEGFFLTGDIGYVDNEGYIYIIGREKDLLKYCSRKFTPSDIEAFLNTSPEIDTICIVGIPDEVCGDLPAAVVVRKNKSPISQDDIVKMVADEFPDNCQLRGGVYFVDNIPKTTTGKLLRRKAQEMAMQMYKPIKL